MKARLTLAFLSESQLLAIGVFEFVIFYPPSAVMTNNQSYVDALSAAPRLVLFGTLAMFAGDIANNYVLAKMKVWTNGGYISARFVTSTLCGQMVNTAVFYIFGLWKMIPTHALTKSIVIASLTKVSVELLLLPATLKVSSWLKRIENVDYFDKILKRRAFLGTNPAGLPVTGEELRIPCCHGVNFNEKPTFWPNVTSCMLVARGAAPAIST